VEVSERLRVRERALRRSSPTDARAAGPLKADGIPARFERRIEVPSIRRPSVGREECRIRAPFTEWLSRLEFIEIRRKRAKKFEFKRSKNQ
jgi:hypothetical protein